MTEVKNEGAVKRPWRQRMDEQLAHLSTVSRDQAALKAADALHNAQSILRDVGRDGLDTLRLFNCSVEEVLGYYGAVADGVRDVLSVELKLDPVEPRFSGDGPALFSELDSAVLALTEAVDKRLATDSGPRCGFCGAAQHDGNRCAAGKPASALVVENRSGQRIRSLAHWFHLAPPIGQGLHWVNGRSARELARAWSSLSAPAEVMELLRRTDGLRNFQPSTAIAELVTPLDEYGTGRNHDLVLLGTADDKKVLVGIEAKNDEELGPMIGAYLASTKKVNDAKIAAGKPGLSKVPERIEGLNELVFGSRSCDTTGLRYQLLHGLGGTLIEAAKREADIAVFLIQVFKSCSTDQARAALNAADISNFADRLAPGPHHDLSDRLLGPVEDTSDSEPVRHVPFYFGVVHTTCSDSIAVKGDSPLVPALSA